METSARRAERRPIFAPGVGGRLLARAGVLVAYVVAAVPAGLFRGYADNFGLPVHSHFNAVESVVFWDGPSRFLQSALDFATLHQLAVYVYASWFFLPLLATLPLFSDGRRQYWRLVGFLVLTYYAGMPFFALFPLQPPWMHDPSVRHVLALVNPGIAGKDDNPFAAMPSLHVALPAAAAFWYGWKERAGRVIFGYSLLIAVTVLYTGDHYPADICAGYALAGAVYLGARRLRLPLLREPLSEERPREEAVMASRPRAA